MGGSGDGRVGDFLSLGDNNPATAASPLRRQPPGTQLAGAMRMSCARAMSLLRRRIRSAPFIRGPRRPASTFLQRPRSAGPMRRCRASATPHRGRRHSGPILRIRRRSPATIPTWWATVAAIRRRQRSAPTFRSCPRSPASIRSSIRSLARIRGSLHSAAHPMRAIRTTASW